MAVISLSPSQSQILAALRVNLLQKVLPQGSAIFQGSVSGTTLTVSKVTTGLLADGDALFGRGVLSGTQVVDQLTGTTGSIGTYKLNKSQTVQSAPLCTGVPIIQGQGNRVAMPPVDNYVIFTPMFKPRLATNIDSYVDCYFQASITDASMTVTDVAYGTLRPGAQVFGVDVEDQTFVVSGPSDGGPGVYTVSLPQTVSLEGMACGAAQLLQKAEFHIQLDFYGTLSPDYAQTVSTVFRDVYGVDLLAESGLPISPLYADSPHQGPLVDGEQEYENRWTIDAVLQADQTLSVTQQFASSLSVDLIEVETTYPF